MSAINGVRDNDTSGVEQAGQGEAAAAASATAAPKRPEPGRSSPEAAAADTVEKYQGPAPTTTGTSSAVRHRLGELQAEMARLQPKMMKAREAALREMPKLVPGLKWLKLAGQVAYDLARGKPGDAAKRTTKEATKEGVRHILKENLGAVTKLADALGPFKDAYDISTKMREYGRVVKEYEALQREAQSLELKLEPSKRFKVATIGGKTYYRTGADGHLVGE